MHFLNGVTVDHTVAIVVSRTNICASLVIVGAPSWPFSKLAMISLRHLGCPQEHPFPCGMLLYRAVELTCPRTWVITKAVQPDNCTTARKLPRLQDHMIFASETYPRPEGVNFFDAAFDDVAFLQSLRCVLYEIVSYLGDVQQRINFCTDVHKSTKLHHPQDLALYPLSSLEVFQSLSCQVLLPTEPDPLLVLHDLFDAALDCVSHRDFVFVFGNLRDMQ
mmetsp:Transcript_105290/g.193101  ORF Transcript_105290/g.193101 Transcript_105290/m.193101 type:complete len:220 (+) Transcript_105290:204-863(+)